MDRKPETTLPFWVTKMMTVYGAYVYTVELFVSSILTSVGSGLMHKVSTGPKQIRLPACVIDAVSYKGSKLTY